MAGLMTLAGEIRSMYQQIVEWNGDFGDPIETGSFNPFDLLRHDSLTEFEREGVCVAMLCYLQTAIDNSTYEEALSAPQSGLVRDILRDAICENVPRANQALSAFLHSQEAFTSALDAVYREIVIPHAQG